jgi:outer membrane protein TolC
LFHDRGLRSSIFYFCTFQALAWSNLFGYQIPLEEKAECYFPDLNLTLRELELKSPVLTDQQYDLEIAELHQSIARSEQGFKFGVNVYGQSIHEDRPNESFYHRYRALNQVYLKKPIFHWGALEAEEEIARLHKDRSLQALNLRKQTLRSEVSAVFLELVVLKFRIELALNQINLARQNVSSAEENLKLGRGTLLSLDEAKAELISREIALSETKSSLKRKHNYFSSLSGNKDNLNLDISDRFKDFCLNYEMPSDIPIQVASISSGEIEDLKLQSKIQDQSIVIAEAGLKPKVNLTSAYFQDQIDIAESGQNLDRNNLIVGLEANWAIWDSGKSKAQKRAALLRKSKIEGSMGEKREQARSHIQATLEELESLKERITLGRKLIQVAQSRFEKSKLELDLNRISPISHFASSIALDSAQLNNLEYVCRFLVLLDQYEKSVSLPGYLSSH